MLKSLNFDESNCFCCVSEEERIQLERSRRIDRELAEYKKRYKATQKLVLLGAGESGKSTFLKQMQIIHGKGFTLDEKYVYRTQVYENIMKGIVGLINGKKDLQLPWRGNLNANRNSEINLAENTMKMKEVLNEFLVHYKYLMEDRLRESMRLNKTINITPDKFNGRLKYLIIQIWNDDSIREAYDRRREFPRYYVENLPYFIQNLDRITREVNIFLSLYSSPSCFNFMNCSKIFNF